MERTLVNSGDLYQLSEELDWQVCRVPRIPNFKPVKKRSFRLSWGSSMSKLKMVQTLHFTGGKSKYLLDQRLTIIMKV